MTVRPGWTAVLLQELIAEGPSNGFSPPSDKGAPGTLTLKLSATTSGRFVLNDATTKRIHETIPRDSKYWLRPGDIVIQRANSLDYVGTTALFDGPPETYIYPDLMMRVRAGAAADASYLCAFLNGPIARAALRAKATGTAGNMPKINGEAVRSTIVYLPPLNEQRRIVAKLEALQARSRRAREALDAVPPLLAKLRQSILAAAFRGDLTKDWRAKHSEAEPASKLLERIRVERRRKWEAAELAKLVAKGKAPKGDDWRARYKEPEPVDAKGLPGLPKGWCWASIDELCPGDAPAVYGIILPGDDVPNGVPYVRPVDMRDDGTVDFDSIKRTTTEIAGQYVRASLRAGDVVLSIVGTIGKVVIVPPELDGGNITQSSARIRPPRGMAPEYVALALKSPTLTRQFDAFRFGNAVQRLNVEHVRRLGIPLAPNDEQAAIVQRAESALGSVPSVLLAKLKEQVAVLDRVVLAKAFRGELVPQDPNDEPAEVMLARVRAESEAANSDDAPKAKRTRKTADGRR